MYLSKTLLALAAATSALAGPIRPEKRAAGIRGVNLGGWLVLEPWITPSIFQKYGGSVVDEYTLTRQDPNANATLRALWSSWVTLSDFQRIAGSGKGINLVRIPVGYWAFQKYGNEPYVQGAKAYLAQALEWASQTGLKVWIDLHGAPLSQNGFDNSGQRTGSPQFTSGDTIGFMAGVLGQVAAEFGSHPAVSGIELVNEPLMDILPGGRGAVESFYAQAGGAASGAGKSIVISDGFAEPSSWNGRYGGYVLDHHEYQVFKNEDVALSYQEHANQAYVRAAQWAGGVDKQLICGEWTAAMTDCAPALVSLASLFSSTSSSFLVSLCLSK